jgi:hypothetical protein
VWYDFNDRQVTLLSEDAIVSPSAYVLYYVLVDENQPVVLPPLQEAPDIASNVAEAATKVGMTKRNANGFILFC